jgi:protein TonB
LDAHIEIVRGATMSQTPLFQSALLDTATHNRLPTILSIAIQASLVAALIAIPLLHPEILSAGPIKLSTLAPPPLPAPKPPPLPRPIVTTTPSSAPAAPSTPSPAVSLVESIFTSSTPAVDAPALAVSMNTAPAVSSIPASLNASSPNVTVTPTKPATPTRVSQGVSAGLLLAPIQPVYPPIAKMSRTEGTVVIQAIISKSGHIESAHVISGPAMLQGAAIDAVRAARYHPYLLNNEPTEVETTISIIFHLSS